MEEHIKNSEVIDLRVVFRDLLKRKKLFIKVWIVTFIVSCVYILPQPRVYMANITLAPELGGQSTGGTLSSIASSFGFDLGNMNVTDAFYPELYPDVMETNEFLVDLLDTHVKSMDGAVDTTYLGYILKHRRKNPYAYPFNWCRRKLMNLIEGTPQPIQKGKRLDPLRLTRTEDQVVALVRNAVKCDVDIKTNVITITVKEQDPLICATLADSARVKLQDFITKYRTSKACIDVEYYRQLTDSARVEYEATMARYSRFCDAHQNVILQSLISERDQLENDLQAQMSTYNAMQAQYQAAKAKVQEQTPAFTVLSAACVPVKPQGPKRMIFVAAMLFLATLGTCLYLFKDELIAEFLGSAQ